MELEPDTPVFDSLFPSLVQFDHECGLFCVQLTKCHNLLLVYLSIFVQGDKLFRSCALFWLRTTVSCPYG